MARMAEQRDRTTTIFRFFEQAGFHPIMDARQGDGYFTSEHTGNIKVRFHIKELKGWRCGIWWDVCDGEHYHFFTQFEREIGKFSPTTSTFVAEGSPYCLWSNGRDAVRILQFIKRHPYKARMLDVGCWQNLWDYDAVKGAFWECLATDFCYKLDDYVYERMNKKLLKLLNAIIKDKLIEPRIVDKDKGVWERTRYAIVCKGAKGMKLKPGTCHSIELNTDIENRRLLRKIHRFDRKIRKACSRFHHSRLPELDMLHHKLFFTVRKEDADEER